MGKRTKFWSSEELDLFRKEFLNKTTEELIEQFQCTKRQVATEAKRLGLTKRSPTPKVGDKIFNITILEIFSKQYKHGQKTYIRGECDCDKKTIVEARLTALVKGSTKSCGCWKAKQASETCKKRNFKHGYGFKNLDRLYRIWTAIRVRCNNKNFRFYKYYGGRGIKLCEEWQDYKKFYDWSMNNGYTEELTIDRINNDGNYEPNNCRWATYKEQARNRSNNRLDTVKITAFNETKSLQDWLDDERCGVNAGTTICYRIGAGWTPEDAISKPSERSK